MEEICFLTVHALLAWVRHVRILQPCCLQLKHIIAFTKIHHAHLSFVLGYLQAYKMLYKMLNLHLSLTSTSTAPATKRKKIACGESECKQHKEFLVPSPSQEELSTFFHGLSETGKSALLSIIPEYSDAYILDYSALSAPLQHLYQISRNLLSKHFHTQLLPHTTFPPYT